MPHPVRQRILITGASSGLGEGMARRFAAKGRDLALVARRADLLEALRTELLAAHPGIRVVTAALDVDDAEAVARVVPALAGELGGLDRVIVNAGIGKGGSIGTGRAAANRAVLLTNVLGAHAQCEAAMEVFRAQGAGHLVLISSVASVRGMRGTRTAYGASKAAVNALAEGIRSDVSGRGIVVTTILPGYIATDINVGRRGPMTVDLDTGVDALAAAIEREPVEATCPGGPGRRSPGCCGCCRCAPSAASPDKDVEIGGAGLAGQAIQAGLVDELRIFPPLRWRPLLPLPPHSHPPSPSTRQQAAGGGGPHRRGRRRAASGGPPAGRGGRPGAPRAGPPRTPRRRPRRGRARRDRG